MPRLGLGLGLTMGNILGVSLASTLADLYVARVATIPDFVVPSYARVVAGYGALINAYATGTKAAFETATAMFADPSVSGYVLGTGTGLTAGAACARVGNMACFNDNSRDLVQATPLNQPWLLVHTGTNYVAFPGADLANNFVETNANVNFQVTSDFTIVQNIDRFTFRGNLCGSRHADANAFGVNLLANGTIQFVGKVANINVLILNSTATISTAGNFFIKVKRTGNDYTFWYSALGVTYTQVGSTITNSTALAAITSSLLIGGGSYSSFIGIGANIIRSLFYQDSTETNLIADFNPALYNASVSQTQFTAATGEIYALTVGSASTGFKAAFVDRTIIQTNGNASQLTVANLALPDGHVNYCAYSGLVQDGTGGRNVYCSDSTNRFTLALASLNTNITFQNLSSIAFGNGSAKTLKILGLVTQIWGTNISRNKTNNGSFSAAITGAYPSQNGFVLGSAASNDYGNNNISSLLITKQVDDATAQTAIYNYIRSINNNAF